MLSTTFAITWKEIGSAWFQRLVIYRQKLLPTDHKLIGECDKSFADDLVASRYCKHESSLCATICWDFSCVPSICSSLFRNLLKPVLLVLPVKEQFHENTYISWNCSLFFFGYLSITSDNSFHPREKSTVAILAQGTLSGWSGHASLCLFFTLVRNRTGYLFFFHHISFCAAIFPRRTLCFDPWENPNHGFVELMKKEKK